MDLDYLYDRHQVAMMAAAATTCSEARAAHQGMAMAYARTIRTARRTRSAGGPAILASSVRGRAA